MLNILHITPTYLPALRYGGPIKSVHGLCRALAKSGHHVQVLTTNVDGDTDSTVPLNEVVEMDGVQVWYFPSHKFRRIYFAPAMKTFLHAHIREFDLLHLHCIYGWPMAMAASTARKYEIPYVVSPRGMLVDELIHKKNLYVKSLWITLVERRNLRHAAGIHLTTEREVLHLKNLKFRTEKTFVIPNGVDSSTVSPQSPHQLNIEKINKSKRPLNSERLIIFLGRICWTKGLDRLIAALPFIENAHLIVAGSDEDNYQSKLVHIARSLNVESRVTFIGFISDDADKFALLKGATILVLPSYSENFGNVVLEAMSVGCPVVVSPGVGLASMVQESGVGLVVNNEPGELGRAINKFLAQPDLICLMRKRGPEIARTKFNWNRIAGQMAKKYKKILEESKNQEVDDSAGIF